MLKFLRKYNTIILVVFGSLLMVAFLVPQAIQSLGQDPKGRVVAKLGDKSIRAADYQFASQEMRAVASLAPQLVSPGGMLGFGDERNDDARWILMTQAASDAGLIGEGGDGEAWVPDMLRLLATQIAQQNMFQSYGQFANQMWANPQFRQQEINNVLINELLPNQAIIVAQAAGSSALTIDEFYTALAKVRGMFRLIDMHNRMARLSLPRAEAESKSVGDQAIADALFLPGSLVESEIAEPTEEQLLAHFERFREVRDYEGDYGIGYFMQPRVKIEVLKLDHEAIASAFTPDPVDISRRWQRNKDVFGEDFIVAQPKVEKQLRDEFADDVLRKADRHIKAFTVRARDQLESDGEYYVLPENWSDIRPTLEQAATYVVEQVEKDVNAEGSVNFTMPRPIVTVLAANWSTFADLQGEESIAGAGVTLANQRIPIASLVFAVREFEPEIDFGFQVGLPAANLRATDALNSHYFFTVLAVQEESPAASLDEVRETAIADYTRLAAYELLVSRLDEYMALARADGLQAVSDLFATEAKLPDLGANIAGEAPDAGESDAGTEAMPGPLVQENLTVGDPSMVAPLPGPANDQLFREAVLEAAALIDPYTLPDDIDPADAIVGVALPGSLGVELGRIRLPRPLTIELYRMIQFNAMQQLIVAELRNAMADASYPYSYENLAARYEWRYTSDRETSSDTEASLEESATTEEETASGDG